MPPSDLVLAFDTSAAHCAAALYSDGQILAEALELTSKGQTERLFPMMEEMLTAQGLVWKDITRIGVGVGPGNFTGIRISVSGARGLALSLGVPAVGVNSFEALGYGLGGKLVASVDARGGRCYVQNLADGSDPILTEPENAGAHVPHGFAIVGHAAAEIATLVGGCVAEQPMPVAVAIAKIAAEKVFVPGERPVPLYVRAPDAAPSRHAPPKILT